MVAQTGGSRGAWAFESRPKAVSTSRAKATPTAELLNDIDGPLNIMSDPRVVRGSTYSLYRSLPGDGAPMEDTVPPTPGGAPARKARRKKKKADGRSIFDAKPSSNSKQALDLTPYLVEKEYASSAVEEAAQTDGFLEQPPPAPFAPPKTGVDASTSMEDDQPFVFNNEVQPLLAVLVSKTLEQAMLEVEQEEELAAIADDMSDKLARQAAEKARVEAMEQAEVDREKAKLGDFESARAALVEEQTLARKVASSRLVDQLLPEIFEGAYRHFEDRGSWVEPVLHEIKATTLPWLYARVDEELEGADLGAKLVDDLLQYCVDQAKMREPEPEPEPEPADEPEAEAAPDGDAPPADDAQTPAGDDGATAGGAGDWAEQWDESARATYWYNAATGEASWTEPQALALAHYDDDTALYDQDQPYDPDQAYAQDPAYGDAAAYYDDQGYGEAGYFEDQQGYYDDGQYPAE